MIVVRLNGGLGNQLFQYAAGFALAKKNDVELKIDVSAFDASINKIENKRELNILEFNISAVILDRHIANRFRNPYGNISRILRFIRQRILKRYYSDWHPHILNLSGNVYLEGYFQCEKYFYSYRNLLLQEFNLLFTQNTEFLKLKEKIKSIKNAVSLHVRRGDYVSNNRISKLHNICSVSYYLNAITLLKQEVGECKLIIFSDDIEWVKNNIPFESDVLYVSNPNNSLTAAQELILMSCCKHHIISNSSFSWWGAHLNHNAEKKIIAPSIWNRSLIDHHKNIIPENWIKINPYK